MSKMTETPEPQDRNEFLREAESDRIGLLAEFWDFLKHNKKWWLAPILVALVLIGVLAIMAWSGGAATPFIYTLF